MVAGDLLDHVDFELAVGTPRRDRHPPAATGRGAGKPDGLQIPAHVVAGEGGAQDLVDSTGADDGATWLRQPTSDVDQTADGTGAGHLAEQGERAGDGPVDAVVVDAPLEAGRRLRAQAEAAGGAGDRHGVEVGGLE